jgi:hypothetical protein
MSAYQANPAVYSPGATTSTTDARRVYQGLGALAVASGWAFANYNSLQFQVTERAGHGLTLLGNYVYSRCMDNSSDQVLGADAGGGGEFHKTTYRADYARCDFDLTDAANVSLVYDLPKAASLHGPVGKVINGWSFTTIFTERSGLPFSVLSGRDNSLTGAPLNDLADQIRPDANRPSGVNKVHEYFDTSAFTVNAIGTFGNTQRNTLIGPGAADFDIGLIKQTPITERLGLQFRAEAFNVFNHSNFANPVNTVTAVNFGKITSTVASGGASGTASVGDPRVLQFALKFSF